VPESRPLVGRRAELAQCRGALAAVADGQAGAVIVVRGEPGIGKTRFVEELQSIGAELGFARHIGWALDFGVERGRGALGALVRTLGQGDRREALALVREGLAASEETSPRFVGPILYGLLGLIETERSAREAALAAGEALLAKGAGGHNHFWFRRYAIEAALQAEEWYAAEAHADALARRTAAEPLPYSDLIVTRGRILARMGRGIARDKDAGELAALRAKAAAVDFRIDALREALRAG